MIMVLPVLGVLQGVAGYLIFMYIGALQTISKYPTRSVHNKKQFPQDHENEASLKGLCLHQSLQVNLFFYIGTMAYSATKCNYYS